nr:PREDICTED: uncharacterized protein LOC109033965 [Bemisia tabaci]XP_018902396.1 PREDICTED: uncharacterized protein LOC109033965 [Bemisia tabaci]XP_018902397.1 PREDICTED: uncharacterized protein LOC109033965 [Bemisia tabaci]XP_018902398.1 PREDICTED: uncharacterized protein LOC109033965 [Bemisia tabaci]
MNLYKRGMIFITFLGSCVAIMLIGVALTTNHWVDAQAKRTLNPQTSTGRINFGLFQGEKSLNVGYGSRTNDISIVEFMREDPEFLVYNYWLVTVASMALGLVFSIIAAIFSVINTATTPITSLAGIPGLYLWNIISLCSQLVAILVWSLQYYEKLQYNVMSLSDRRNFWTSEGLATFGISFWFVTAGIGVNLINLLIIYHGTGNGLKKKSISMSEEKGNGAIMLY